MDFLGFLGSAYTFFLVVMLVISLGLALMAMVRFIVGKKKKTDIDAKHAAQGGASMNNWLRYALYSFLGILLLVAIMGLLAPDNQYGNMNGMQMRQMGPMYGGPMNMGSMPPMGAVTTSGMAGMPMQPMGNMGLMGQMGPMRGAAYPQGAIPMNGVIVMPLPNGGVAVMPMNNMGQMPQGGGMGMMPTGNMGQMPQGGGMGVMPVANMGQMPQSGGMGMMGMMPMGNMGQMPQGGGMGMMPMGGMQQMPPSGGGSPSSGGMGMM